MNTSFAVFVALLLPITASCTRDDSAETASTPSQDAQADSHAVETPPPTQRVVVVADDDTTIYAILYGFEGAAGAWTQAFSNPVTIGRNGLGWGIGLHEQGEIPQGDPIKHEGDGKAPMGAFALPQAWGYLPAASVDTRLPYERATPNLLCIDDVGSPFYNSVVDREVVGLPANDLPSHEDMLRGDDLYKYTIFVAHNSPNPQPGAGSCIFMHIWSGADAATAGCTSMDEADMVRLVAWLDPAKSPTLVQLTRARYEAFETAWDLPPLP